MCYKMCWLLQYTTKVKMSLRIEQRKKFLFMIRAQRLVGAMYSARYVSSRFVLYLSLSKHFTNAEEKKPRWIIPILMVWECWKNNCLFKENYRLYFSSSYSYFRRVNFWRKSAFLHSRPLRPLLHTRKNQFCSS